MPADGLAPIAARPSAGAVLTTYVFYQGSLAVSDLELSCLVLSWWRYQMKPFSALLALCVGNSPVTGEFPAQRPVTWSFNVFFDPRLNKQLSKQLWGWSFEMPLRQLWRHCNVLSDALQTPLLARPHHYKWPIRADSRFAPSQWQTSLQSNAVSHWLGANLESALANGISKNPLALQKLGCNMIMRRVCYKSRSLEKKLDVKVAKNT